MISQPYNTQQNPDKNNVVLKHNTDSQAQVDISFLW